MSEWVYFIRNTASGAIKIGYAKNAAMRFSQVQMHSADPLELLGVLAGGHVLEKQLHQKYAHQRIRGEWFSPTEDILSFIAEKTAPSQQRATRSKGECQHVETAARWVDAIALWDGKPADMKLVSSLTGFTEAKLLCIHRRRPASISVADFETIRTAYIRFTELRLAQLSAELAGHVGGNASSASAHLAAARSLLNGTAR